MCVCGRAKKKCACALQGTFESACAARCQERVPRVLVDTSTDALSSRMGRHQRAACRLVTASNGSGPLRHRRAARVARGRSPGCLLGSTVLGPISPPFGLLATYLRERTQRRGASSSRMGLGVGTVDPARTWTRLSRGSSSFTARPARPSVRSRKTPT